MGTLVSTPALPESQLLPEDSRPGRSGPLSSLFPASFLFPPQTAFPGLAQKSPGSDLPWGGNRERVRLVNSAGVSRGWEGTLGQKPRAAHTEAT